MTSEERIVKLETSQPYIMEKIDNIERLVIELRNDLKEALEHKANKWTETFLIWAGMIIGAGLLTWLGTLIYKATLFFQ